MFPVDVGTAVTVELTERIREVGGLGRFELFFVPNRPFSPKSQSASHYAQVYVPGGASPEGGVMDWKNDDRVPFGPEASRSGPTRGRVRPDLPPPPPPSSRDPPLGYTTFLLLLFFFFGWFLILFFLSVTLVS